VFVVILKQVDYLLLIFVELINVSPEFIYISISNSCEFTVHSHPLLLEYMCLPKRKYKTQIKRINE